MKTKEEILNEYMPKESGHFSKKCILKAMQTYADQFKNEWVSVEDRLPEIGKMILIWRNTGEHDIVSITSYHNVWFTHWQHLPSPPKTTEI